MIYYGLCHGRLKSSSVRRDDRLILFAQIAIYILSFYSFRYLECIHA